MFRLSPVKLDAVNNQNEIKKKKKKKYATIAHRTILIEWFYLNNILIIELLVQPQLGFIQ